MSTHDLLTSTWRADPLAIALSLAALTAFAFLSRKGTPPRAGYLTLAVAAVALAVASPVGALADGYLFSAHMLQHLLLVLVVPPLALLSAARDKGRAEGEGEGEGEEQEDAKTRRFGRPLLTWLLGVGAMWIWHAPTLCNAASQNALVHRLQEASLLAMGTAFWWPILARRARDRLPPLAGIVYLFTACTACTLLGIIVTFSPVEVCSVYLHPVDRLGVMPLLREGWGLTAAKDQQLGGLLMWVPACLVYATGILGLLARWYASDALTRPVTRSTEGA